MSVPIRSYTIGILFLVVLLSLSAPALAKGETSIGIDTRDGVQQRFLIWAPKAPKAVAILFTGKHGNIDLSGTSIRWGSKGILVHSRKLFVKNNIVAVLVDSPSDKKGANGMYENRFRSSSEHVVDIGQVIAYLRQQYDLPIWLVGMSRGTESVANIVINSKEEVDGIVLMSSIYRSKKGTPVVDFELETIDVPVMLIAHKDDICQGSPPEGAKKIASRLTNSRKVQVKYFSGGDRPSGRDCGGTAAHGFPGLEKKVIAAIAEFIAQN